MALEDQAIGEELPAPRQGVSPVVRIRGAWRALPGFLFGFRQPAIIGELTVRTDRDIDLALLDRAMADLTRDFELPLPEATLDKGLVSRALGLAIALQNNYRIPVQGDFYVGSPRPVSEDRSSFEVAFPYYDQAAARIALSWAIPTLNRLVEEAGGGPAGASATDALSELGRRFAEHAPPNVEIVNLLRAAIRQAIPVHRVIANVYCYGTGCHRRLLDSTVTDGTSELGCRISRNKVQTAEILRQGGLPAPRQLAAPTAERAVAAADSLGYPVVIKPVNLSQGEGVFAGLKDAKAVREAFEAAVEVSDMLIVEKHFHGRDYRLTVLNGEVIKAERRIAGGVTGDGHSTIAELLALKLATPRFQRILRTGRKQVLALDDEAQAMLRELGLAADSVVEDGRYVQLRRKNNVSTGGEQVLVPLDEVHPDNLELAIRAANLLDLDLAGVDLIIPDLHRPWTETGALICEINARPEIGTNTTPTIHDQILRELTGPVSRIPVHLLIVSDDRIDNVAAFEKLAGELSCNGISTQRAVWIDGKRLPGQPEDAFAGARMLLRERMAQSALCVMPFAEVIAKGLPTDWFDSIRIETPGKVSASLVNGLGPQTDSLTGFTGDG
ncbi:MAG: acetate--CoA ligase family protein [Novosphingobium sp.]|nr:acetate--CoA ligase family protein [Novosphingobium sp.]